VAVAAQKEEKTKEIEEEEEEEESFRYNLERELLQKSRLPC